MKKSNISQIAVLCGLALGVMALWAGAAPIGVNGDQVIGGWYADIAAEEDTIVKVVLTRLADWLPS